ncbi:hypothetical protein EYF80_022548 [Liparis tanakae]|uniref:Uncharacterized protein n=1 Tax=Liparis tanakae TaxID=230148 RepID=A0A4Z2HNM9_9TELE|nr:hypothetical protein EYF80_022548 [Liparis tanakae]
MSMEKIYKTGRVEMDFIVEVEEKEKAVYRLLRAYLLRLEYVGVDLLDLLGDGVAHGSVSLVILRHKLVQTLTIHEGHLVLSEHLGVCKSLLQHLGFPPASLLELYASGLGGVHFGLNGLFFVHWAHRLELLTQTDSLDRLPLAGEKGNSSCPELSDRPVLKSPDICIASEDERLLVPGPPLLWDLCACRSLSTVGLYRPESSSDVNELVILCPFLPLINPGLSTLPEHKVPLRLAYSPKLVGAKTRLWQHCIGHPRDVPIEPKSIENSTFVQHGSTAECIFCLVDFTIQLLQFGESALHLHLSAFSPVQQFTALLTQSAQISLQAQQFRRGLRLQHLLTAVSSCGRVGHPLLQLCHEALNAVLLFLKSGQVEIHRGHAVQFVIQGAVVFVHAVSLQQEVCHSIGIWDINHKVFGQGLQTFYYIVHSFAKASLLLFDSVSVCVGHLQKAIRSAVQLLHHSSVLVHILLESFHLRDRALHCDRIDGEFDSALASFTLLDPGAELLGMLLILQGFLQSILEFASLFHRALLHLLPVGRECIKLPL